LLQTESGTGGNGAWRIESFEYPADPDAPPLQGWLGWSEEADAAHTEGSSREHAHRAAVDGARAEAQKQMGEEVRKSFESGREKGKLEGRQSEREAQAGALVAAEEQRVRQAAELVGNFSQQLDRYLQAVEHEVVELALMVAARILRREAQMDPLLLTGAVRVALGQLSGASQVRLRVPASELSLWTETILRLPKQAVKPEVLAGDGMRLGDCRIETEMGSVDLGVRAQLGEIERGFFDRVGGGKAEEDRGPESTVEKQASLANLRSRPVARA
jgi:flagellar assembly protein FliH